MSRTEFQNLTTLACTKKLFQMGKGWKNELQLMFLQADINLLAPKFGI
jgi:hypothetical protein